jgi:tripartite-type tricarboxylate transporter receptor subunit TctC
MESIVWASIAADQCRDTVRTLVPYPPEQNANLVAESLRRAVSLGGRFSTLVDVVPSAKGAFAIELVANACPPNGALLLVVGSGLLTLNRHVEVSKPLIPLSSICAGPCVFVVPAASGLKSVEALVKAARERPHFYTLCSVGPGSVQYALCRLFANEAKVDLRHVSARSSSSSRSAVAKSKATVVCDFIADVLPLIDRGHLRPIAVTSATRSPALPDVPSVREIGLAGCAFEYWLAYFASGHSDSRVIEQLSVAINLALREPALRDVLTLKGAVRVGGSTKQSLSDLMDKEADFLDAVGSLNVEPMGLSFLQRWLQTRQRPDGADSKRSTD